MKKDAIVVTAKCPYKNKMYGIRLEKKDGIWLRTWAFPTTEEKANFEHFGTSVDLNNMETAEEYPSCPHCKSKNLVQCGVCHKILCFDGKNIPKKCPWCNIQINGVREAKWDSLAGGGF